MTAIEDTPLPPFLALPDGETEPVPEEALQWLTDRIHDEPEWSLDRVLESAVHESDPDDPRFVDTESAPLRWEVDGPATAEWAMRKLAACEAEGNEVADQAAAWVAEITRWEEARLRPLAARSGYFTERLTRWLRIQREADPGRKSIPLPSGTIQSRTVPPKIELVDEAATIEWVTTELAYAAADIVKTTRKVSLTELKRHATVDEEAGVVRDSDTGQPIPGTAVSPGGVSFSVRVGG